MNNLLSKIVMILCTFSMLVMSIVFYCVKLVILILFMLPLLFMRFDCFSRIVSKIQEGIEEGIE